MPVAEAGNAVESIERFPGANRSTGKGGKAHGYRIRMGNEHHVDEAVPVDIANDRISFSFPLRAT